MFSGGTSSVGMSTSDNPAVAGASIATSLALGWLAGTGAYFRCAHVSSMKKHVTFLVILFLGHNLFRWDSSPSAVVVSRVPSARQTQVVVSSSTKYFGRYLMSVETNLQMFHRYITNTAQRWWDTWAFCSKFNISIVATVSFQMQPTGSGRCLGWPLQRNVASILWWHLSIYGVIVSAMDLFHGVGWSESGVQVHNDILAVGGP